MWRAFGHRVATCWVLLAQVWNWSNLSQQHPTCRNTVAKCTQHVAPNNVAICCVGMLRSFGRGFIQVSQNNQHDFSCLKTQENYRPSWCVKPSVNTGGLGTSYVVRQIIHWEQLCNRRTQVSEVIHMAIRKIAYLQKLNSRCRCRFKLFKWNKCKRDWILNSPQCSHVSAMGYSIVP